MRLLFLLPSLQEIGGRGHGRTGIETWSSRELRQCAGNVKVRRMAQGNSMHLARSHQAAKYFANLAPCRKRSQEELDIFHAGRDDCLQIN
jgi:hypothetical protein